MDAPPAGFSTARWMPASIWIDSANVYARGASETILGKCLKGRRDKILLASKVGMTMGDGPNGGGLSYAAILKAVDDTLRRLQTDYLDIYYLHQPDYNTPIEETLEATDPLILAG